MFISDRPDENLTWSFKKSTSARQIDIIAIFWDEESDLEINWLT